VPRCGNKVKRNAAEAVALLGGARYQSTTSCGPEPRMTSLLQILLLILDVAQFIIIAHIIMSWLINFQVLNLRQQLVAQIWDGLNRVLEPVYGRVRAILPQMGGLDLAPLVVLLGVYALRIVLINNAAAFY
jgi:YggT family protein